MPFVLGTNHSLGTRAKMSATRKGKPKSPEHRAAIGLAIRNSTKKFRLDPDERQRRIRARRRVKTLRQYGVTEADYDRLLTAQKGVCAICGTEPNGSFCVDHSHATGAVRGLLCRQCNLVVGNAREHAWILKSAAAYVTLHQEA